MKGNALMDDKSRITRFALVRHAETQWNREHRIQGQEDSPLTRNGENRARKWGQLLKAQPWDRIISSDSGRALSTALIINDSLRAPLIQEPRLREQDWGQWTGKTMGQLSREAPAYLTEQEALGWGFCPPGGEDRNDVLERSREALQEADEHFHGEKILVITHEGVIKSVVYRLYARQFFPAEPALLLPDHLHWLFHNIKGLGIEMINALKLD
jgi:broad specificity phosphatase PhoE